MKRRILFKWRFIAVQPSLEDFAIKVDIEAWLEEMRSEVVK